MKQRSIITFVFFVMSASAFAAEGYLFNIYHDYQTGIDTHEDISTADYSITQFDDEEKQVTVEGELSYSKVFPVPHVNVSPIVADYEEFKLVYNWEMKRGNLTLSSGDIQRKFQVKCSKTKYSPYPFCSIIKEKNRDYVGSIDIRFQKRD